MRIVLDTNVLVSALITPLGNPARILDLIRQNEVSVYLDQRVIMEYEEVLSRPAFPFLKKDVDTVIDMFRENAVFVSSLPLKERLPDPDDECFLEIALHGKVDALVTGNLRHYPENLLAGVKVLTPKQFLDIWRKNRY